MTSGLILQNLPPDHRSINEAWPTWRPRPGRAAGLPVVRGWPGTCSPLLGDALPCAERLSRDSAPVPRARAGAFEEGTAEKVSTGALPGPLRHFLAQLDELRSGDILDMDQVGRLLVGLAADEEYLAPLIAQIPAESPGGKWLVKPDRGPRLVLFHRPEGMMACTHSHHCWVGVAPVRGVETHQRWDVVGREGGRAELRLADDRAMHRGDVATLTPPGDVHNHGHVVGTGPSPYSLILLGDNMYLYEREEYDPERGTWRRLAPGDEGRSHR